MTTYTRAQLETLARVTGFPNVDVAVAVALAESGGNTRAVSSTGDYGLWQINHRAHPTYDTGRLLTDPGYNAAAALAISKQGTDWTPWTTYRTGAYKHHLTGASSSSAGINLPDLPDLPSPGDVIDKGASIIGGAATSWVEPLVARAGSAALALMLTAAGLALIGLGLARLTSSNNTVQNAVQAAGTVATTAAIV